MKHITISANKKEIEKGISPIISLLEEAETDFVLINKIEVAIDEVLTNIAMYAYSSNKGNIDIDYQLDKENRTLTVVITDGGKEFNPLIKEDPNISIDEKNRQIGGLGIFIVKNVMDEITYQRVDNKNILTLNKII